MTSFAYSSYQGNPSSKAEEAVLKKMGRISLMERPKEYTVKVMAVLFRGRGCTGWPKALHLSHLRILAFSSSNEECRPVYSQSGESNDLP